MSPEPESLILQLLRAMRAEIGDMRTELKSDIRAVRAELKSDMHSLRADIASDFIEVRKEIAGVRREVSEQIVGLRRAVIEVHTSVIGHGILISELEARLRRVEQHLDLPPPDAHRQAPTGATRQPEDRGCLGPAPRTGCVPMTFG